MPQPGSSLVAARKTTTSRVFNSQPDSIFVLVPHWEYQNGTRRF